MKLFLILSALVIVGLAIGGLFLSALELVATATPPYASLRAAAAERAREGEPILQAIYRYKARTGLFPMSLGDLSDELGSDVLDRWSFSWTPASWTLSTHASTRARESDWSCYVRFSGAEWMCFIGRDDVFTIEATPDLSLGETLPPDLVRQRTIEELERRIRVADEADRHLAQHYQGLVSFLRREGLYETAVTWCLEMRERSIEPWWAEQMLARVRHELGMTELAAHELRQKIEAEPSFIRWTYLASYYRATGDPVEAVRALQEAVHHDLANESTGWSPWAYAFDAGAFAYDQGELQLTIAICDVWESFADSGSDRYRPMRAAANLALGRCDVALVDAQVAAANVPDFAREPGASDWATLPLRVLRQVEMKNQLWRARFDAPSRRLGVAYR